MTTKQRREIQAAIENIVQVQAHIDGLAGLDETMIRVSMLIAYEKLVDAVCVLRSVLNKARNG